MPPGSGATTGSAFLSWVICSVWLDAAIIWFVRLLRAPYGDK
jgi:hypothetical protein